MVLKKTRAEVLADWKVEDTKELRDEESKSWKKPVESVVQMPQKIVQAKER
jgi:ribonuclease HIII